MQQGTAVCSTTAPCMILPAAAHSRREIDAAFQKVQAALDAVPLHKPEHPLRVGIVGEYYTVMDDFGNHNVERILA